MGWYVMHPARRRHEEAMRRKAAKMSVPKQALVVRADLGMPPGKLCVQGGHAAMKAFLDQGQIIDGAQIPELGAAGDQFFAFPINAATKAWLLGDYTKVALRVESEAELLEIHEKAKAAGLLTSVVTDLGKTVFQGVATKTAVVVGPAEPEKVNAITGHLKRL